MSRGDRLIATESLVNLLRKVNMPLAWLKGLLCSNDNEDENENLQRLTYCLEGNYPIFFYLRQDVIGNAYLLLALFNTFLLIIMLS